VGFDVVIRGGTALDGLGGEPVRADVGVQGDRIEAIAPNLAARGTRTLDAGGLAIAPGFIDIHTHGDIYPLICPESPARLHDGVTTEVVGNCGESPFPQNATMLGKRRASAERYGIVVDWQTLDDFARRQGAVGSGINRASLVGHSNVRETVLDEVDRDPSAEELAAMRRLAAEALEAGAFGLSTGLIYAPGMFAKPREIEALAEVVARRGALYASHVRGEGDHVEEAVDEFLAVGRKTGVRLQLSHVKVAGQSNWAKADRIIERLEAARAEGLDLACDRYPYVAAATSLSSLLPGWAREGGTDRMIQRIADPATRTRMLAEVEREGEAGWRGVVIADAGCPKWKHAEGRSVHDLGAAAGRPPAEVVLDLLTASESRASIIVFSMCEENLVKWLRLPYVAIGSDSVTRSAEGPTAVGKPHPRSYGTSSRVLGRYVREQGVLALPDAVRRLTSLPASRLGMMQRGVLRAGAFADVTVFDPRTIADRATYEFPQQYSVGVRHVLVNGRIAVEEGELTGVRAGRFLRRGHE